MLVCAPTSTCLPPIITSAALCITTPCTPPSICGNALARVVEAAPRFRRLSEAVTAYTTLVALGISPTRRQLAALVQPLEPLLRRVDISNAAAAKVSLVAALQAAGVYPVP